MGNGLRIVIWGLGRLGKNIIDILGLDTIVAIIDSDVDKLAQNTYLGIPIISFEDYKRHYGEFYIVITPMKCLDIENKLQDNHIHKFFVFNKCKVKKAVFLELLKDEFIVRNGIDTNKPVYVSGKDFSAVYIYLYLKSKGISVKYSDGLSGHGEVINELVRDGVIEDYCNNIPDMYDACIISTDAEEKNFDYKKCSFIDYTTLNENAYLDWRKDMREFKDRYCSGERIFIIATGPSLKISDVERLKENREITMSVNHIYRLFDKTDWRPDYYVVSDGKMMREYERDSKCIRNFDKVEKFFSDSYLGFWEKPVDKTFHGYSMAYNQEKIRFSSDCSEVIYAGSTVVYACLQIAAYMGFKEIYLLGCDFDYTYGVGNHFYTEQNQIVDFDYEFVQRAYIEAKKYAEEHDIKIYNATRGGRLEVFERIKFDEVFFEKK